MKKNLTKDNAADHDVKTQNMWKLAAKKERKQNRESLYQETSVRRPSETSQSFRESWRYLQVFNAGPSDGRDHCCNEGHP